ncbi:Putative nucleotidyltransferase [Halorhabdus sp. SVX81]|uniref:hypothetical protein n=1 Tax=Halorhabdus sp. SVX81 TaxID=2978283 RepID=UPI0023DBB62F|nr:hypothetical protein [Halorhabdus sp. SVX81]WEL17474.1 Putative nucleotidyltransferase [Halorhabdus sp. SVX81]
MSLPAREQELPTTLESINGASLPYVLVGGWAITAFNQRFSTDVDLVVPVEAVENYESFLGDRDYDRTSEHDTNGIYEGQFIQYSKDVGNPVSIELMVDALRCRQTEAEWSYRYLDQHAQSVTVGRTQSVTTRIPERELLLAIKLHSGRFTDARDVVAAADDADFDRIEKHLHRGDPDALAKQLRTIDDQLTDESFVDSFKGEFQQQTVPEGTIERVREFLATQRDRLQ